MFRGIYSSLALGICVVSASSGLAQQSDSLAAEAAVPKNRIIKNVAVQVPNEIVVSPDSSTVYTVSIYPGTLSVIDAKNNYAVKATTPVAGFPLWLAISPDGKTLYVTNNEVRGLVSVIDTTQATYPVTATIEVGLDPQGVAVSPDGKEVYVANFGDYGSPTQGTISVLNTATNQVTTTINCDGNPYQVLFTKNGRQADVLNEAATCSVQLINTISQMVTTPVAGVGAFDFGYGMTIDRTGSTLYLVSEYNYVAVVRASDGVVTKEMTVASNPFSMVSLLQPAITPSGKYLYVPYDSPDIAMIDVGNGQIVGPLIHLPQPASWTQTSPDGKTLYVSSRYGVTVIDITP